MPHPLCPLLLSPSLQFIKMSVVPQVCVCVCVCVCVFVCVYVCVRARTRMTNPSSSLEIRESLGKCGAVPPLMWLIRNSTTHPVLAAAAAALGNLVRPPPNTHPSTPIKS